MSEGLALMREGRARCLGQAAERRWSAVADVPTFREQGFDVLGGSIANGSLNMSEGLPLMREGRIRCLAQGGPQRWAPTGDVPTFREQGFDVLGGSARGIAAPPGLPAEIAQRLQAAFREAMADAGFVADAERAGMPLRPLVGDAYKQMMREDHAALQQLWQRRPWREG